MLTALYRLLLGLGLCLGGGAAMAGPFLFGGPFHLHGEFQSNHGPPILPFDVFADIAPVLQSGPPIRLDLADAMRPTLNRDVDNHALFNFGLLGAGGAPVTFDDPAAVLGADAPGLLLHTQAHFGTERFFDVFFDVFYMFGDAAVAPDHFSQVLSQGPPIFPAGSLALDFAAFPDLQAGDPPFFAQIFVIDPDTGLHATFAAIPEPGTLLLAGIGLVCVARRRCRAEKGPGLKYFQPR